MYKPKVGEWVKIVDDNCMHGIRRGTIIKIEAERQVPNEEMTWWIRNCDIYIVAEDIARLNPSLRKTLKTLEKSVKRSMEEAVTRDPSLKSVVRDIVMGLAEQ